MSTSVLLSYSSFSVTSHIPARAYLYTSSLPSNFSVTSYTPARAFLSTSSLLSCFPTSKYQHRHARKRQVHYVSCSSVTSKNTDVSTSAFVTLNMMEVCKSLMEVHTSITYTRSEHSSNRTKTWIGKPVRSASAGNRKASMFTGTV